MIQHSIAIDASAAAVFRLYANATQWSEWDSEVKAAHLESGLTVGSKGWLAPRKGPKARIEVVEVTPDCSFTVVSKLPLCQMIFGHELRSEQGQTIATHWVRFDGLLAPLFSRLIGGQIDATLPETLRGLKRATEAA